MSLLLHVQMRLEQHSVSSRAGCTFQFLLYFRNPPFQDWALGVGLGWLLSVGMSPSAMLHPDDSGFQTGETPEHWGSPGNYFLSGCAPLWLQLKVDGLRHDLIYFFSLGDFSTFFNFWDSWLHTEVETGLSSHPVRSGSKPVLPPCTKAVANK